MTKLSTKDTHTIQCSCGCSIMQFNHFGPPNDEDFQTFIEVFTASGRASLWMRLKRAVDLVVGRTVPLDSLVLEHDQTRGLIHFLQGTLEEAAD